MAEPEIQTYLDGPIVIAHRSSRALLRSIQQDREKSQWTESLFNKW